MAAYTHTYAPRIVLGTGNTLDLSNGYTPLLVMDEQYSNRVRLSEVPLRNGVVIYDVRRGGAVISCQGMLWADSKEDLQTKKDNLHRYLIGGRTTPSRFTFYRYYDTSTKRYRWWRNCVANDLQFNGGSRAVRHVPYSFSFTSEDGYEYEYVGTVDVDPENPVVTELLEGPRIIKLDDDAGVSKLTVVNSAGDIVFSVDSTGNVSYIGTFEQVEAIT